MIYLKFFNFYQTTWLLKNMIGFYNSATHAVEVTNNEITWAKIRESMNDLIYKLSSMKFEVSFFWLLIVKTFYIN